jgi:predicted alpha/beta hydrolase family esterase
MKTAIILHGMPSKEEYLDPTMPAPSKAYWLPWLQQQLESKHIETQTPDLPNPYEPDYKKWCAVFEAFPLEKETILVGHSCGAGFLLRWLSEHNISVGPVILVAPFLDPDHDEVSPDFFAFRIDPDLVSRTNGLHIIYSKDDEEEILKSVEQIHAALPAAHIQTVEGKAHFTTHEIPEVLEALGLPL